jgi:hypothetical protein
VIKGIDADGEFIFTLGRPWCWSIKSWEEETTARFLTDIDQWRVVIKVREAFPRVLAKTLYQDLSVPIWQVEAKRSRQSGRQDPSSSDSSDESELESNSSTGSEEPAQKYTPLEDTYSRGIFVDRSIVGSDFREGTEHCTCGKCSSKKLLFHRRPDPTPSFDEDGSLIFDGVYYPHVGVLSRKISDVLDLAIDMTALDFVLHNKFGPEEEVFGKTFGEHKKDRLRLDMSKRHYWARYDHLVLIENAQVICKKRRYQLEWDRFLGVVLATLKKNGNKHSLTPEEMVTCNFTQ